MAASDKDQFLALTGLRGVAALAVLQWHAREAVLGSILPGGYLAVDFFFLLSGWVMAHAYDGRLAGGLSGWRFLGLRLGRLYPVYLLVVVLTFCGGALSGHLPLSSLLLSLFFLPDLLASGADWLVSPAWSLAAELAANIPFGVFHRKMTTRLLLAVVIISAVALALWALSAGTLDLAYHSATRLGMFPRVFFSFPLGILLYRHRARLASWAPAWASWPAWGLLIAVFAAPAPAANRGLADVAIVILVLPLLLLFAANARPRLRTAAIALAAGAASYPLYLIQVPLLQAADILSQALTGASIVTWPPAGGLALLGGIVALAFVLDRIYDRPVRAWLMAHPLSAPDPAAATRDGQEIARYVKPGASETLARSTS